MHSSFQECNIVGKVEMKFSWINLGETPDLSVKDLFLQVRYGRFKKTFSLDMETILDSRLDLPGSLSFASQRSLNL